MLFKNSKRTFSPRMENQHRPTVVLIQQSNDHNKGLGICIALFQAKNVEYHMATKNAISEIAMNLRL